MDNISQPPEIEQAAEWVALDALTPWDKNPRHNDGAVAQVAESIQRFGFAAPIVARRADGQVIAGHTRLKAARSLGLEKVPVRYMDLDPADARLLALADNKIGEIATWDDGLLAEVLAELEGEGADLTGLGWGDDDLGALVESLASPTSDGLYATKLDAPIYEPKGDCPPVRDLVDSEKTASLLDEIEAAALPAELREFLQRAAERHTSFHFARIAEFYCHAAPEVQHLMERSGLVIIDFDKAIEYGFVQLTERLSELVDTEAGGTLDAP